MNKTKNLDILFENINFPLGDTIEGAKELIRDSKYSEFYTGIKHKKLQGSSFSHHFSPTGCFEREDLIELIEYAALFNKKINVAMNIYFYSDEIKSEILGELEFINSIPIGNVVLGNLEVFFLAKQNFSQIRTAASSLFGIRNIESAMFFKNLGFDKLIFPRSINIDEVFTIGDKLGSNTELEAFIYGGGCAFCESSCHMPHVLLNNNDNTFEKLNQTSPFPICEFPVRYNGSRSTKYMKLHPGEKKCGVCYIHEMYRHGITKFKVTGRSYPNGRIKALQQFINKKIYEVGNCELSISDCLYGKEDITNGI